MPDINVTRGNVGVIKISNIDQICHIATCICDKAIAYVDLCQQNDDLKSGTHYIFKTFLAIVSIAVATPGEALYKHNHT